jgi:hypothetical protein
MENLHGKSDNRVIGILGGGRAVSGFSTAVELE